MPNKNYIKGRRKEYYIKDKFQMLGYLCFRSAGSHSPVDVVAIHRTKKKILLIQAKPKSMSKGARLRLEEHEKELNGEFEVEFVVI